MRDGGGSDRRRAANRIIWFAALWAGGVAAVGLLAYAIRLALGLS